MTNPSWSLSGAEVPGGIRHSSFEKFVNPTLMIQDTVTWYKVFALKFYTFTKHTYLVCTFSIPVCMIIRLKTGKELEQVMRRCSSGGVVTIAGPDAQDNTY